MNWTACENCGIAVYDLHEHIPDPRTTSGPVWVIEGSVARLRITPDLRTFKHCNASDPGTGVPLLVPPTWSKAEHHRQLAIVWQHAARELATAQNIIIIGYSLPETDAFFRYLYALGTASPTRIERFWVINQDQSGVIEQHFEELLGPTPRARLIHFGMAFSSAVRHDTKFQSFLTSIGS